MTFTEVSWKPRTRESQGCTNGRKLGAQLLQLLLSLAAGARALPTTIVGQLPMTQLVGTSVRSTPQRELAVKHVTKPVMLVVEIQGVVEIQMVRAFCARGAAAKSLCHDASTSTEYSVDVSFDCLVQDL